jgi:hypothetical protein
VIPAAAVRPPQLEARPKARMSYTFMEDLAHGQAAGRSALKLAKNL